MEKKLRNSNHELLRLLSMYMIIFIHANMYLPFFCKERSWYLFFNGAVNGICNTGVTCFILITGFYGLKFDLKKLIKMEVMMIIFSLLELLLLYVAFPQEMVGSALIEQLIKSCFPFLTRKYWFYSCYLCLFIFSDYINRFLTDLKKKELEKLLVTMLLLFSVLPTFFYFEIIPDNGKGLIQMIMIYLLGRYIRMYGSYHFSKATGFFLFVTLWIVNGISHEVLTTIGPISHHFCKDNSITNIVMAVLIFQAFREIKITSKIINKISAWIFAVFALNNSLVRIIMEYFKNSNFTVENSISGFLLLAASVLAIYIGCLLVGAVNEKILGKIITSIADKITKAVERKLSLENNV